jgi:beta-glucosidase
LKRGETRIVRFTLDDRALSMVDPQGRRMIAPGRVRIWIGGGQPGARNASGAGVQLQVVGRRQLPL